jgi:hypothetical protein
VAKNKKTEPTKPARKHKKDRENKFDHTTANIVNILRPPTAISGWVPAIVLYFGLLLVLSREDKRLESQGRNQGKKAHGRCPVSANGPPNQPPKQAPRNLHRPSIFTRTIPFAACDHGVINQSESLF